jgi:hypothetical protein
MYFKILVLFLALPFLLVSMHVGKFVCCMKHVECSLFEWNVRELDRDYISHVYNVNFGLAWSPEPNQNQAKVIVIPFWCTLI